MGPAKFVASIFTGLANLLTASVDKAVKLLNATDGYIGAIDKGGQTLDKHAEKMLQDVTQQQELDRAKHEAMMSQSND